VLIGTLIVVALTALPLLAATALAYAHGRGQRGDAGTEPLHWRGALGAFVHEWLAGLALLAAVPFRVRATPLPAGARGVVISVPELYCSSAGFWYLRRRLSAAGWASVPGLARHARRRDAFAALDACIAQLPAGTEIVFLGHGNGGLIARAYAEARPQLHVRHVITLGTPHQGSHALPYRVLGRPQYAPSGGGAGVDVIAIYSDFDAWLSPIDDAYCPGGFNIAVRGLGHCAMLQSRRVADLIAENLAASPPKN
jgi:pimeloyl-ACP methyl ester carboxylesterase